MLTQIVQENTTRRGLIYIGGLGAMAATMLALTRCGAQNATVDAQALADAKGLQAATANLENALVQYAPTALNDDQKAKIATLEAAVVAGLQSLTTSTPAAAGATTLQTIDSDLNQVLAAIGAALPGAALAIPALAPFVPIFDAAVAVLPVIEAYVNSVIPAAAAAATQPVGALNSKYSVVTARSILRIPTLN